MLPPITPSVPGRSIEWDADAPVVYPTKSLLTLTDSKQSCSSQAIPDGRVVWCISQRDVVYADLHYNSVGMVSAPGTRSSSNGEGILCIGWAADEETFLTQDDSVTEVKALVEITSHPSISDETLHEGTLFMVPGDVDHLWMVVQIGRIRDDAGTINYHADFEDLGQFYQGTFIMRSDDWGETWEHYSTLHSRGHDGITPRLTSQNIRTVPSYPFWPYFNSEPTTLNTDEWRVGIVDSGGVGNPATPVAGYVIRRSRDNGLTWTNDSTVPPDPLFRNGANNVGNVNTARVISRNISHTGDATWVTLSQAGSGQANTIYTSSDDAEFFAIHDDDFDGSPEVGFFTRGAQSLVWNDGNGGVEGLWMDNVPSSESSVNDGLHYVTAPDAGDITYDPFKPDDVLIDGFQFTNWPTSAKLNTFIVSPGINYYHVACNHWVLGIRGVECAPPRDLHVPHKRWAKRKEGSARRARDYRENWEALERWAANVNTTPKCVLHIPRKNDHTPRGVLANWLAFERWVDSSCLCCVQQAKHRLHIPTKDWDGTDWRAETDNWEAVERWVAYLVHNCG